MFVALQLNCDDSIDKLIWLVILQLCIFEHAYIILSFQIGHSYWQIPLLE